METAFIKLTRPNDDPVLVSVDGIEAISAGESGTFVHMIGDYEPFEVLESFDSIMTRLSQRLL